MTTEKISATVTGVSAAIHIGFDFSTGPAVSTVRYSCSIDAFSFSVDAVLYNRSFCSCVGYGYMF